MSKGGNGNVQPSNTGINVTVTDEQQPKLPFAFAIAMFIGPFVWLAPAGNARNLLIPQLFSEIDPSGKIAAVAFLASLASIVGLVANVVFGALSDMTRSRWGKRKPWIVGGTLIQALMLVVVAQANSILAVLMALYCRCRKCCRCRDVRANVGSCRSTLARDVIDILWNRIYGSPARNDAYVSVSG